MSVLRLAQFSIEASLCCLGTVGYWKSSPEGALFCDGADRPHYERKGGPARARHAHQQGDIHDQVRRDPEKERYLSAFGAEGWWRNRRWGHHRIPDRLGAEHQGRHAKS